MLHKLPDKLKASIVITAIPVIVTVKVNSFANNVSILKNALKRRLQLSTPLI